MLVAHDLSRSRLFPIDFEKMIVELYLEFKSHQVTQNCVLTIPAPLIKGPDVKLGCLDISLSR